MLNGRKLVVAQAQVSDTGLYQCVATNIAGDNKKEFEVTVHGMSRKAWAHCVLNYSGFIHCLIQIGAERNLELYKVVRKG